MADLSSHQVEFLLVYAAMLWLPGLAMGALAGLRGWALAALAPLLTYGLVTMSGPALAGLGIPWGPSNAALVLCGALAVLVVLRWPLRRWTVPRRATDELPAWTAGGHTVVAVLTAASGLFGAAVLLAAFGGMASVSQDWDAILHANAIRYIAETGESGIYSAYTINGYAGTDPVYYPNAYHLMGALVYELTGAYIPTVLNAQSLLMPIMLALTLVAVVRRFHGRVALAGFAVLVAPMPTAMPYDVLWRGPLLPFATGVMLSLGLLVVLRSFLDRPSVCSAVPLGLAGAGLLGLHPSAAVAAGLFAVPMLAQRWWARPRRIGVEPALLTAVGIVTGITVLPYLLGALQTADAVAAFTWPQALTPAQAFGEVVGFSTAHPHPQYWLLVPLLIGIAGYQSLGQLRWLLAVAGIFTALYVLSAAYPVAWAQRLTSVWWNDRFRLAAIAAVVLVPLVAHGLMRSYDLIRERLVVPALARQGRDRPAWAAAAFAIVLAVLLVGTEGGYAQRNIERTAVTFGPGTTVNEAELAAFEELERLVQPGEMVMNDRFDGSGWMYALAGVRPVAAHFGLTSIGADPELLGQAFDEYDTNPEVRAAARRLNVQWVMISPGYVRDADMDRQPGLDELDQVDALTLVYDRDGVRIYALGDQPGSADPAARPASDEVTLDEAAGE